MCRGFATLRNDSCWILAVPKSKRFDRGRAGAYVISSAASLMMPPHRERRAPSTRNRYSHPAPAASGQPRNPSPAKWPRCTIFQERGTWRHPYLPGLDTEKGNKLMDR